ncbi:MAG: gluconokinase [Candidatus Binatia bacterium]|nr:gluconokinase [Candidatus Binatia bacterium]
MIVILMGVSGAGKTTIGQLLATHLGWPFYEGDDFHPQANIDKLRQGIPLTDQDRDPWIAALQHLIRTLIQSHQSAVIACSALKQSYRDRLQQQHREVIFVYLKGERAVIAQRLHARVGHFMNVNLLASQYETLEEPVGAITIDITHPPETIVRQIQHQLHRRDRE